MVQISYGQKDVAQITILREYCVRRTQTKQKLTRKTNNENPIV